MLWNSLVMPLNCGMKNRLPLGYIGTKEYSYAEDIYTC